jgi:L-proline amide hydrolase
MEWDEGLTWYRVDGDLGANGPAPLVILHGGPGAAHDYLEPVAELASSAGRPCVLYDQIGCGRSEHLPDAPVEFWTVELFSRELRSLLEHLAIERRYHVLGQSWGGMLGAVSTLDVRRVHQAWERQSGTAPKDDRLDVAAFVHGPMVKT